MMATMKTTITVQIFWPPAHTAIFREIRRSSSEHSSILKSGYGCGLG